jgi:hypothetical protein
MRWSVALSGSEQDVRRLAEESVPGLSADTTDPRRLLLELHDPEGDATGDDAPRMAKHAIDVALQHLNGFGRLRWGRVFEGVSVTSIKSFDLAGNATHRVFLEPLVEHMTPESLAEMVEGLGHPRPGLPASTDVVNALDGATVAELAEEHPDVGRVLHLIDLMLVGDDEIDWVAAHSALEVIEHDLARRRVGGVTQGWWTKPERRQFRHTANSVEALGFRARHGVQRDNPPASPMTAKEASWLIRRAAAHCLLTSQMLDGDSPRGPLQEAQDDPDLAQGEPRVHRGEKES